MRGEARESAPGRTVIELEAGITVYPPQEAGGRWRAVWTEDGRRRYCEAVTGEKLVAMLAKVTERLEADAPGMERSGADLIAWYLSPDRLPAGEQWSTQVRPYPAAVTVNMCSSATCWRGLVDGGHRRTLLARQDPGRTGPAISAAPAMYNVHGLTAGLQLALIIPAVTTGRAIRTASSTLA